ncbi:MAG TPA: folate family ECF transporter S component [Clostridia bacterium]|nr:folate family ECF transporter S component [Clostridia bacterium]
MLKNNKKTETNGITSGEMPDRLPAKTDGTSNTKRLVLCALFVALGVILGGLLSIPAMPLGVYSLKIGFGTLPVILSGVLFGPVYGGIVGGLTDFLQAVTFSKGAYMPWFTITGILFGLIPGLFFIKRQKPTFLRILLAVFAGQTVGSVLLNTWLISTINSLPFWATFAARAVNQAVMIPVYTVLVYYIIRALRRMKVIE